MNLLVGPTVDNHDDISMDNNMTWPVINHDDLTTTEADTKTINYDCLFDTAADVEIYVKEHAEKNGFEVNKSFTSKAISELEDTQICVRGYFLCKQCETNKNVLSKISKKFVVRFSRRDSDKKYYIKKETSILSHNHSIPANKRIIIDDNELIRHKDQLSKHELYYFHNIGPYIGASKLKHILSQQFPNRVYTKDLTQRLIKEGKLTLFGSDPDRMRKLLEKGSLILKENGVFEFTLDDACRIRSVYIQ